MSDINIDNFNTYIIDKAFEIAKDSKCLRKKVGAILTFNPNILSYNYKEFNEIDYDDAIISTGFNKPIIEEDSCEKNGCLMIGNHCQRTRHAELTAFDANKHFPFTEKWLYITTAPCLKCLQEIVIKNIKIVWCGDLSYWSNCDIHYINYIQKLALKFDIQIRAVTKKVNI